ncbi:MAG: hypothetical protein WA151_00005, partial [Desulfatirhabdiaceae bacterium]
VANKTTTVNAKAAEIDAKKDEIEIGKGKKRGKEADVAKVQVLIDGKRLYIAGLEKRKQVLESLPDDPIVSAWCADLTENLSGEVATIEPYGEYNDERTLIRPGYDNRHIYNADRDGQLQFVKAMTVAQAFYNLAMLPGWQRWMPTYRIGEITAIDHEANTCNLTLETVRSSQQRLLISGWPTLTGVPFEYMTCNSAAFEVWDKVVIEYRFEQYAEIKVARSNIDIDQKKIRDARFAKNEELAWIKSVQSELDNAATTIANLEKQIDQYEAAILKLNADIANLDPESPTYAIDRDLLESGISAIQATIAETLNTISTYVSSRESDIAEHQEEIDAINSEIDALQLEIDQLRAEIRAILEDTERVVIGFESEPKPCESFGKMTFNGFDFQPDNYYIFVLNIQDTDGTVGIIACDTEGKFRFPEGFSGASTLSLWYVGGDPGVYRGWAFEDLDDWLVTGGTATANGDGTCTLSESTTLYQGVTLASRSMVINWIYIRALIVHEVTGTLTVSTPSGNISITAPGAYAIPVCYEIYGETGAVNHNFMCYTSAGGSAKISHPMQWFSGKRWNFANLSDNSVNQLFDGADFVDHTPEDVSGYSGYTADAFQYYIEQPAGGYDEANGLSRYCKTTFPFQFAIHGANSELSGDEAWTITLKRCRQLLLNTPISALTTATIDFFGQTVTAKLAIMPVKKIRQQRTYHSYGSGCFCINGVSWN